MHMKETIDNAS